MKQLLDNYAHANFPMEVQWGGSGKVRLVAGFPKQGECGKVVGFSYHVDSDGNEFLSQAIDWDGLGKFAKGRHPGMDLVPPPALVDEEVQSLTSRIAEIRARLDANPDAPKEWRARDEHHIGELDRKIKHLRPDLVVAA